jgi:hypothetical protein
MVMYIISRIIKNLYLSNELLNPTSHFTLDNFEKVLSELQKYLINEVNQSGKGFKIDRFGTIYNSVLNNDKNK